MAITKLTAWAGEAEVLGRLVKVGWEAASGLVISGLSDTEATEVLDVLSAKAIVAVNPAAKVKAAEEKPAAAKAAKGKAAQPNTSAALEAAKIPAAAKPTEADLRAATSPEQVAQMAKATDGLNAITNPPPEVTGYATQVEAPKKAEEPKAEQATSADKAVAAAQGSAEKPDNVVPINKAGPPEGAVPDLTKAKQLKDVVAILNEHYGIKDVQAMIKKCEELKASVPVLSRISDIPTRVERTMVLLGA